MLVRGIGVGLAIMPAMTAAFSRPAREQVNDASPQLTVLQRVGGSLGHGDHRGRARRVTSSTRHTPGRARLRLRAHLLVGAGRHPARPAADAAARADRAPSSPPASLADCPPTRRCRGGMSRRRAIEPAPASPPATPPVRDRGAAPGAAHMSGAERRLRGRDHSRPGELTFAQIRALAALGREHEMTAGQLARSADLNPARSPRCSTISRPPTSSQRHRSTEDRRVCNVSLTAAGLGAARAKARAWHALWEEQLAGMSDSDLEAAARVVGQVTGALRRDLRAARPSQSRAAVMKPSRDRTQSR